MLKLLTRSTPGLRPVEAADLRLDDDAVWLDLHEPSREEELAAEAALGVPLPTREEMAEIEPSSRLYREGEATVMIATVLIHSDTDRPTTTPVTFVLTGRRLVTIRYAEPKAFTAFAAHAEREPPLAPDGAQTLVALLDAIVDRLADVMEHTSLEVEQASRAIFTRARGRIFEKIINRLGRAHITDSKARDSLVSLARLVSYASLSGPIEADIGCRERLKSLQRDIQSLTDHASYQSGNITFLLDAALGLINIEQNSILKVFSVFSLTFIPPTLIAGIYGMNFHHMPELDWRWGYPVALGLMVAAMATPIIFFRRRGWL